MFVISREYRLLMSKNHPLADKEITVDDLLNSQLGQVSLQGDKKLSIESRFKDLGLIDKQRQLSIPIQLSNFNVAPDNGRSNRHHLHYRRLLLNKLLSSEILL
eukprot:TRINITY_DN14851_c0_g1_i1.p1 TRINITY_DN14851_c0_g1~~TRINITY_DN14851_c0_g1_i1.p1  ORF type:complete len:103 (+),score=10.80 TRINITY_DN14851_c0_g1_i1:91-399(+)